MDLTLEEIFFWSYVKSHVVLTVLSLKLKLRDSFSFFDKGSRPIGPSVLRRVERMAVSLT